jgi:hypothetical protein
MDKGSRISSIDRTIMHGKRRPCARLDMRGLPTICIFGIEVQPIVTRRPFAMRGFVCDVHVILDAHQS